MKILFMTSNREGLVRVNNFTFVERAMGKFAECKWAGNDHKDFVAGESLDGTIKRLYGNDSPDWVIIHAYTMFKKEQKWVHYTAPRNRSYKIAAVLSDIHSCNALIKMGKNREKYRGAKGYVRALNEAGFDACLMTYTKLAYSKDPYEPMDPEYFLTHLKPKICFRPPCIDPSIYKPSDKPKLSDVAFLGVWDRKQYPIRTVLWRDLPQLARRKDWRLIMEGRPAGIAPSQDRIISELLKKDMIVGERYAEILRRAKTFIFGCSIYKYPLYKYFEGMGSRTCVMADTPFTAEELHFIPDWNFVEINKRNWQEELEYYLSHDEEREEIARRGHETVMKYHTVDIRGKEIVKFLEMNK